MLSLHKNVFCIYSCILLGSCPLLVVKKMVKDFLFCHIVSILNPERKMELSCRAGIKLLLQYAEHVLDRMNLCYYIF